MLMAQNCLLDVDSHQLGVLESRKVKKRLPDLARHAGPPGATTEAGHSKCLHWLWGRFATVSQSIGK